MLRWKIILLMGLFSFLKGHGQEVNSKAYELMLSGLLSHSVNEMDVKSFAKEIDSVLILDAREEKEYKVSHIPNAVWIGYEDFEISRIQNLPKDKPVVVYCSVGYRSEKIAERLDSAGFSDVSNLYGGIFEWVNQGHDVVDSTGQATQDIHAYSRSWGIWLSEGKKVY